MGAADRIICAVDTHEQETADRLVAATGDHVGGLKLGLEFFLAHGQAGVRRTVGGRRLFLDLKLHDIPNTVVGGLRSVLSLQPWFLTLHTAGGREMMRRAADAARSAAVDEASRTRLLGVTVLTSLGDGDLSATGQRGPVLDQVLRLAGLARESELDGVIASPHEVEAVRAECGSDFLIVTPGVRPAWAAADDQKRVMSPAEAIAAGADYLVIGRPITRATDPAAAVRRIVDEIEATGSAAAPGAAPGAATGASTGVSTGAGMGADR